MDIYILREGEETGPFTDEAAQAQVAEGKALANDYAWRPGLPEWLPLSEILKPASGKEEITESQPDLDPIATEAEAEGEEPEAVETVDPVEAVRAESEAVVEPLLEAEKTNVPAEEEEEHSRSSMPEPEVIPESEPQRAPEPVKVEAAVEPKAAATKDKSKSETALIEVKPPKPELATEKQKALLNFLGISMPKDLAKDRASGMINDAMENSKYTSQVAQWNEMKLQLHPELFSAEIQARRENRANQFFDLCQTTGAEYFTGITKAHCQVLVGFLDVKFPHWDARGTDAGERYFFPAVAEKFPQLVNKQWRGRLQYGEAKSHDSARLKSKSPTSRVKAKSASPAAAVAKGVFLGGLILCVLCGGYVAAQRLPGATLKDKIEGLTHLKVVSTPSSAASEVPANPESAPSAEPAPKPTLAAESAVPLPASAPASEPTVPVPAPVATIDPVPPAAEVPAIPPVPGPAMTPAAALSDPTMAPPAAALPGMAALPETAAVPSPMAEAAPMAPAGAPVAPGIPTLPDAVPMAPAAPLAAVPPAPATPPADPTMGIPLSNSIANAPLAALPGMEPPVPVAPPPATPPVAAVVPPAPEPAPTGLPPGLPPPTMPGDSAATPPAVPAARTILTLTKPVDVQLAYGKLTLPAGTAVKLISRQGTTLKIGYQNNVITVPATSTDLE